MPPKTDQDRRSLLMAGLGGAAAVAAAAGQVSAAPAPAPAARRRFEGKVVLITGATSGIGAAAAKMFAA